MLSYNFGFFGLIIFFKRDKKKCFWESGLFYICRLRLYVLFNIDLKYFFKFFYLLFENFFVFLCKILIFLEFWWVYRYLFCIFRNVEYIVVVCSMMLWKNIKLTLRSLFCLYGEIFRNRRFIFVWVFEY